MFPQIARKTLANSNGVSFQASTGRVAVSRDQIQDTAVFVQHYFLQFARLHLSIIAIVCNAYKLCQCQQERLCDFATASGGGNLGRGRQIEQTAGLHQGNVNSKLHEPCDRGSQPQMAFHLGK